MYGEGNGKWQTGSAPLYRLWKNPGGVAIQGK
jgi:hypothetical protein